MNGLLKKPLLCLVFLISAVLIGDTAEVKLRIYLIDGTLQAGSLIEEKKDSFIILGQSGRTEVEKSKIMFVNGKTLKQWEERPDKLFQTEILPSDLPNQAFVNSRSLLSTPPAIEPIRKPVQKQTKKVKVQEPVETEAEIQEEAEKLVESPAPAFPMKGPLALDAPATSKKQVQRLVKRKSVKMAKKKTRSVKAKPKKTKTKMVKKEAKSFKKPKKFAREKMANYHYKKGLNHLKNSETGLAMHELQLTTVLDRRNVKAAFQLGEMYMEAGVLLRAAKVFQHPGLKKNKKAKGFIEQIKITTEKKKKENFVFAISVMAGCFTSVPVVLLYRRKRPKRRKRQIILDSETIDIDLDVIETPEKSVAADQKQKEDKGLEPVAQMLDEMVQEKFREKAAQRPEPPPPPVVEPAKPVSPTPAPEIKQPAQPIEPPAEPIVEPVAEKIPILPSPETKKEIDKLKIPARKPPEPVELEIVESEKPTLEPVVQSVSREEEIQSVLRLTQKVSATLQRGHQAAAEENFAGAERDYQTALVLKPSCVEAAVGLGFVYFMKKNFERSLQFYLRAVQLDSGSADAHYGLGRVLLETHGINYAAPEFEKTLALDPSFTDAQEALSAYGKAA